MPTTNGASIFNAFDQAPEKAIELLKKLGIDTSGSWEEMMKDATKRAFIITKVMQADILEDVKRELERALEEGIPFQEFKKEIQSRLERRGWMADETVDGEALAVSNPWRLELIFRNNLQTALNAGRYLGQLDTVKQRPYGMLNAILDKRTTDLCSGLNGTIRPFDDPFWSQYYPPNHHRCRDSVSSLSEREMKRDGLSVTPDGTLEDFEKPGKGFDQSPLEVFSPDMEKYSEGIRAQLKKGLKE